MKFSDKTFLLVSSPYKTQNKVLVQLLMSEFAVPLAYRLVEEAGC